CITFYCFVLILFVLYRSVPHSYLHSFPTRRSSDLIRDRIYQIREQIASLETEQKNLIEILDKEGFILKDFSAESPIPEGVDVNRSEEHTSELQSRENLVCRLLLEKKKSKKHT